MTASASVSMSALMDAIGEPGAIDMSAAAVGASDARAEAAGVSEGDAPDNPEDCGLYVQRAPAPGAQAAREAAAIPAAPTTPRRRNPRRSIEDCSSLVMGVDRRVLGGRETVTFGPKFPGPKRAVSNGRC